MATRIGSLLIRLAVEHGILQEGLARSERDVARTTKAIQRRGGEIADFGQKMSLAVTLPVIGLAAASIKAAQESADAIGQVDAALASMGDQAGRSSEQLQALAATQMGQSLFDDDQILREVTANLLTFGRIANEEFDRAQQAALDLSTRLGTDLTSATVQIGKALNDPIKGVTALAKAGIQFSADQKAMIASLVETGDVAAAQRIILGELEKQFGGAAKAAREADPGAAMAQSFANFQEEIGARLLPLLPPLTAAITGLLDAFGALPEPVQTAVIALAGIAAIVGPIAIGLGALISSGAGFLALIGGWPMVVTAAGLAFNTLAAVIGVLGKALLGLLANPIVLAAAAVIAGIYLAWQNWDKIEPIVTALGEAVTGWYNQNIKPTMDRVLAVLKDVANFFRDIFAAQLKNGIALVSSLLRGDFSGAWDAAKRMVFTAGEAILGLAERLFPGLVQMGRDVITGLINGIKEAPERVFNALMAVVQGGVDRVKQFLGIKSPSRLFMQMGNFVSEGFALGVVQSKGLVADAMGELAGTADVAATAISQSIDQMADQTLSSLDRLAQSIKGGGFLDILGSLIGFGMQLGGIGVFGKSVQANINAPRIPGNANGTAYHPGGMMMVGERGPEILAAPRGSRVVPNHELRAASQAMRAHVTVGIDPRNGNITAYVNGQIAASAPAIANGGAQIAQTRIARRQNRRIG